MKSKYDITRLHKDCLAWCENPKWKPWMVEVELRIKRYEGGQIEITNGISYQVRIGVPPENSQVLEFAHFIGLNVESYRIPEIARDQAVRDYLAGIPEGGELVDGWVKETKHEIITAIKGDTFMWLIHPLDGVAPIAYTFLRLDLREVGK